MTTQARERREGTMPPKAGRGKAVMHAEGRAEEAEKGRGRHCGTRDQVLDQARMQSCGQS